MTTETRWTLLNESLGYWRSANQTAEQGNGRSIEILLCLVQGCHTPQHLKQRLIMNNVPERYHTAIILTVFDSAVKI